MAEEYLTDDEQLEAVKHFLKDNGAWIIGGVLVGAGLFFGMRFYQDRVSNDALAASSAFSAAANALESNDRAKSRQLADAIIKDHARSPYADQARLILARLAVDDGKLDAAVVPLTEVMNGSKDALLRNVARMRLARVLVDQGKPDEAIKTLVEPIPQGFATPYHEIRGDAYAAKKDTAAAIAEYKAALAAPDVNTVVSSVIGLKIQDLGATPSEAAKTGSVDPQMKVKP
jgi:predicted negative regulator of RcsB-dependent stress response